MITTVHGKPASVLGLAAYPDQDPACIERAFVAGINFFFFYGVGHREFIEGLKPLVSARRDDVILASGSGARTANGLKQARRKIFAAAGIDSLDVFFAEYINPGDNVEAVFGDGGVLDQLQQWKSDGLIRFVGASAHDRQLARRLAEDPRVDVLMHRYNMAHRKAAAEVFPAALAAKTPVIAFTATRWSTLMKPAEIWPDSPPMARDCYRFCLAQTAVRQVLMAPKTVAELKQNLVVLKSPPMSDKESRHWERFGDLIYQGSSGSAHDFESRWP